MTRGDSDGLAVAAVLFVPTDRDGVGSDWATTLNAMRNDCNLLLLVLALSTRW